MSNTRKISVSLPGPTLDQVDALARLWGFTRSGLLTALLERPVADLWGLAEGILSVEAATSGDVRRFRGQSADLIRQRIGQMSADIDAFERDGGSES